MVVSSDIEIAAPPDVVRATFLDFAKWPEWHTDYFKSIEPAVPGKLGPGDKLNLAIQHIKCGAIILENTPEVFQWQGDAVWTISGLRTFKFEASKTTPGGTTFRHSEKHSGPLAFMMSPMLGGIHVKGDFAQFNQDLKTRVESLSRKG